MRYNFTNRIFTLFLVMLCMEAIFVSPAHANGDRKAERKEETADRRFLRQKFDRAMALYQKANALAESATVQAQLHAKSGRLYYMLRRYPEAVQHFGCAMVLEQESMTVNDVCDYIDALRFQGLAKQAEEVCLRYAFQNVYSRNQRYTNTLNALSMHHASGTNGEYEVQLEKTCNTPGAEYWIGSLKGQPYYARSDSRFNDPNKRFYYDTEFFPIFGSGKKASTYTEKGVDGPFALFSNGRRIATVVEGKSDLKISMTDGRVNPYLTKLLISGGKRKDRHENFSRLFPQVNGYSYCHPSLFDEGRVLLFASDAPGGYGSYDLYMSYWDDEMQLWEEPVNLGPEINTAGDEMFPSYFETKLFFASNGQPGLGGYDLYSYDYDLENEAFIPGTLTHLPAPVNSAFSDFCLLPMDESWGYFVSDRNMSSGDDVYVYRRAEAAPAEPAPFFGMSEQDAITGGQALLANTLEKTSQHQMQNVRFPAYTPKGLVLTLYFDFNHSELTPEAEHTLNRFLTEEREYEIRNFQLLGYADEMGSDEYNLSLSLDRGRTVADCLRRKLNVPMEVKGCGRTTLTQAQRQGAAELMYDRTLRVDREMSYAPALSFADHIRMNQPARRVDIYVNQ